MLLAYVDESFDRDRYDLGVMLIDPERAHLLTKAMDDYAVALAASTSYSFAGPPEFHGYEIFHAEGQWKHMKQQVRARKAIYQDVLELITDHARAFVVKSVSARRLAERYARPYPREQVAWQFLLQDVEEWCDGGMGSKGEKDIALVIADQVSEDEERRRDLATYRHDGTFGTYRKSQLPHVLDTIHFAPSHHSRLIQAIDCALFISHRNATVKESDPRAKAAVEQHYSTLRKVYFYESGVWPV